MTIICKEHGPFTQTARKHLEGHGCSACNESQGEKAVAMRLTRNNVIHMREYRFKDCKHKRSLPFDFYLPEYHACIEFQGGQHYFPVELYGGESALNTTQRRDQIKANYCQTNNIPLLIIPYTEADNIAQLIEIFLKGISKP
jgi:hypothetical protein